MVQMIHNYLDLLLKCPTANGLVGEGETAYRYWLVSRSRNLVDVSVDLRQGAKY